MARIYSSYLLRRWQQSDGREWVEVQHVATGERHRFASLADACNWLQAPATPGNPGQPVSLAAEIRARDPPTSV